MRGSYLREGSEETSFWVLFDQSLNEERVQSTRTAERRTYQAERAVYTKSRKL